MLALFLGLALSALACSDAEEPRHGRFLIADTDAPRTGALARAEPGAAGTPAKAEDLIGAIYAFDPVTRETALFAQDPGFRDPQALARLDDGSWLVLDFAAPPLPAAKDSPARGAIFQLDGKTGATLRRFDSETFRAPTSLLILADSKVLVSDRAALPSVDRRGAVFELDLESGATRLVIAAPEFRAPSWLARTDDGTILLLDADAKATPDAADEGVIFALDIAKGSATPRVVLTATVSPLGLLPLQSGDLLVFDTNADPKRLGGPLGAVFRVEGPNESAPRTVLVASVPRFRDPVRGCFGGDGKVWFVDANADPEKRGEDVAARGQNLTGPGAIFTLDVESGAIEFVASPLPFVNPVAIAWDP